jgi:hypothetical protein
MDEQDLLNFNYPLLENNQIQSEITIKQQIRDSSLNKSVSSDIERYSDKYLGTVSYSEVMKTTNRELMSLEMQKFYGSYYQNHSNVILNDVDEEEHTNYSYLDEAEEDQSLGGEDDYENNYYDEDERGDDHGDREEIF